MGAPDETKRCSRCGETKPVSEFGVKNKKTGLRASRCRACMRAYGREHYTKNKAAYMKRARKRQPEDRARVRAAVADYLRSHPCVECGESDILLLDFDHRDGVSKRAAVARLVSTGSVALVIAEIAKCDVRCGNCHRTRTAAQLNWRKSPAFQDTRRTPLMPLRRAPRPSTSGIPVIEQLAVWDIGVVKRCGDCGVDKPLYEFAFADRALRTRQYRCRPCHAAARREHYVRNKPAYIAWATRQMRRKRDEQFARLRDYLLEHPCVDCGETDIALLEFDHIDPVDKMGNVSMLLGHTNWPRVIEEIAKCDVRCVNCHRRRTAQRFKWQKLLGEDALTYNVMARGCVVVVASDPPKVEVGVRFASPAQ